jgi:NO-binding membrane sensor protein with MHYT domain
VSVGQFLNQHSFSVGAAFALAILALWLFRDGITLNDLLAFGALGLGLGIAYFFFNPGESTDTDPEAVVEQIGAGTPVLLEFQSPF